MLLHDRDEFPVMEGLGFLVSSQAYTLVMIARQEVFDTHHEKTDLKVFVVVFF